ncbi:unnamed protein product [Linum tenue]|uniref:Amino acid transporter transmembrane domain-containing protein n=1 Tax=Linum tenue TaxID=586396 RepID=A0AAV0QIB6_9ROSI|nr:unnamed protein product [Linum tenue]
MAVTVETDPKLQQDGGAAAAADSSDPPQKAELDAGALFVLESKGSWVHCGYHLTTSIVAPPLLSLPFALTLLGWAGGIVSLVVAALVTFYSYNLLSLVLEHQAAMGRRQLRFRDMANQILGPRWGRYYVGPIQFMVCYGAVVACTLLGGQCMKAIYVLSKPDGTLKLYVFVTIFGCFMLILAQIPSFHSLRHINLVSLLLCLAYSACATAASVHIGTSSSSSSQPKEYSLPGDSTQDRLFGIFNAIAIIGTTYGNGIIPEIQVYLQPTNEVLEGTFGDPTSKQFSVRNVVPRVMSRSLSVVVATVVAAMLPFFGDINALIGAFGFIPLDFILPVVFYNLTFKPSKRSLVFWLNSTIAVVFSAVGAIAAVAAVRQMSLDAKTYRLFANV